MIKSYGRDMHGRKYHHIQVAELFIFLLTISLPFNSIYHSLFWRNEPFKELLIITIYLFNIFSFTYFFQFLFTFFLSFFLAVSFFAFPCFCPS